MPLHSIQKFLLTATTKTWILLHGSNKRSLVTWEDRNIKYLLLYEVPSIAVMVHYIISRRKSVMGNSCWKNHRNSIQGYLCVSQLSRAALKLIPHTLRSFAEAWSTWILSIVHTSSLFKTLTRDKVVPVGIQGGEGGG